jgi:hypothetical protein
MQACLIPIEKRWKAWYKKSDTDSPFQAVKREQV